MEVMGHEVGTSEPAGRGHDALGGRIRKGVGNSGDLVRMTNYSYNERLQMLEVRIESGYLIPSMKAV